MSSIIEMRKKRKLFSYAFVVFVQQMENRLTILSIGMLSRHFQSTKTLSDKKTEFDEL